VTLSIATIASDAAMLQRVALAWIIQCPSASVTSDTTLVVSVIVGQ